MSQSAVKEILQRSGYYLSTSSTLWSCQASWKMNESDILEKQGVISVLLTDCLTEYKQGNKELTLALSFELAQRKRSPDRGRLYEVPTDRLALAIFKSSEGQSFQRRQWHGSSEIRLVVSTASR
jgi:hypothetical protein